jgi:hypothetical protein
MPTELRCEENALSAWHQQHMAGEWEGHEFTRAAKRMNKTGFSRCGSPI